MQRVWVLVPVDVYILSPITCLYLPTKFRSSIPGYPINTVIWGRYRYCCLYELHIPSANTCTESFPVSAIPLRLELLESSAWRRMFSSIRSYAVYACTCATAASIANAPEIHVVRICYTGRGSTHSCVPPTWHGIAIHPMPIKPIARSTPIMHHQSPSASTPGMTD